MRIVIVDDEAFFIEEFKNKIASLSEELNTPLNIVAECYNGQEALEQIALCSPDIVFTDIQMTSLNGIELARSIRQYDPDLPVVIVSAYPSFDYLREAMRVNVTEYLLKPIDPLLLRGIIEKLIMQTQNQAYRTAKEAFLQILSSPRASDSTNAMIQNLPPLSHYLAMYIQNVEAMHDHPVLAANNDSDNERLRNKLRQSFHLGDEFWMFPLDDGRSTLLIVGISSAADFQLTKLIDVVSAHFTKNDITPSAIYSELFQDVFELSRLVPAMKMALTERSVIGKPQYFAASSPNPKVMIHYQEIEAKHLEQLLSRNDIRGIATFLRNLFRIWEQADCPTIALNMQLKEIIHLMDNHERDTKGFKLRNWDARIEEQLSTAKSFSDLADGILSMLAHAFEWSTDGDETDDLPQLFARIKVYIGSHIGQPLSLRQLTEHFHVSKTLLCNLFRDYSGKSFVEYVTTLRMSKAQELMRNYPGMRNKEIAEMVGYVDQNYFSRVFASVFDMSPSEFRSQSSPGRDHPNS